MTHWHKLVGVALGLWLLTAPETFGYESAILAWSDRIAGLVLICLGPFLPLVVFPAVGFWLSVAPLIFWASESAIYLNDTLLGLLLFSLLITPSGALKRLPIGPDIPPGWSYNPSTWPQRLPILFFTFLAWLMARYMTAYQLGLIHTIWDPFFGQGTVHVLTSDVSKAFPVPDAGLGALAYTLELFSILLGDERRWRTMPWIVLVFGVLSVPVSLVSVILIILQPLAVGAWCTLCLATAFCMLITIPLAVNEAVAALQYLKGNWKVLFTGGECPGAKIDHHPVQLESPLPMILRSMKQGVSLPWNLLLTSLLGIGFMIAPWILGYEGTLADLDHIFGPLIVVASVVAWSDVVKYVRFGNVAFAAALLISTFFDPTQTWFHWIVGIVVIGLSLYRGR